jgi:plastocyanin
LSHEEEHGHRDPIVLTSPRRFAKGLVIIVATIVIGAAILVPNFNNMIKNPPPVTRLKLPTTVEPNFPGTGTGSSGGNTGGNTPPPAGATTIDIAAGASVQGSKAYDPDPATVPQGGQVVFANKDTAVHTATSGTGADDPNSGKAFDTGFVDPGKSATITLDKVSPGSVPFYCQVHPFMKGSFTVS